MWLKWALGALGGLAVYKAVTPVAPVLDKSKYQLDEKGEIKKGDKGQPILKSASGTSTNGTSTKEATEEEIIKSNGTLDAQKQADYYKKLAEAAKARELKAIADAKKKLAASGGSDAGSDILDLSAIEEFIDETGNILNSAGEVIGNVIDSVVDISGNVFDGFGDLLGNVLDGIGEGIEEGIEDVIDTVAGWFPDENDNAIPESDPNTEGSNSFLGTVGSYLGL